MLGAVEANFLESGAWNQVSQSPLGRKERLNQPWEWRACMWQCCDGSCFRQPQRLPLWPSPFCNLYYWPEDGALDPGVRGQRLWLVSHLNWRKIRPTRAPSNPLPPHSSPYSAHSSPLPCLGAVFLKRGECGHIFPLVTILGASWITMLPELV